MNFVQYNYANIHIQVPKHDNLHILLRTRLDDVECAQSDGNVI